MGIDWEEMLGAEGDEMWLAYEETVCDAMAVETLEQRDLMANSITSRTTACKEGIETKNGGKNATKGSSFLCKVVGVTFDNPDGENRQDVIRGIINEKGDGSCWAGPGRLNAIKGENIEDIEVYVDDKLIGCVPWEDRNAVAQDERTQSLSVFVKLVYYPQHDIYTGKLFASARNKPTSKMEYAVKKVLEKNPHLTPPEETFDAYREFLDDNYSSNNAQSKHKERRR